MTDAAILKNTITTTAIKKRNLLSIWVCIGFVSICLFTQLTNGMEWASLDIAKTQQGEIWRLITGHLTHLDWEHFSMNMAAIILSIMVFYNDVKTSHWVNSFVFISLFSSLCMCFGYVEYERYVGFSDVIHGWILLGAASIAYKEPKLAAAIFILLWLKIIEENLDLKFFTSYVMAGNVAHESHIYGSIGGVIFSLLFIKSFRDKICNLLTKNKSDPDSY